MSGKNFGDSASDEVHPPCSVEVSPLAVILHAGSSSNVDCHGNIGDVGAAPVVSNKAGNLNDVGIAPLAIERKGIHLILGLYLVRQKVVGSYLSRQKLQKAGL